MKLPLLPGLLSLATGLAAAWVVPQAPSPVPVSAPAPARPARPLPLVKSGGGTARAGRGEDFARLFPKGDWQAAAEAWAAEDPAGFYDWLVSRGIAPGEEVLLLLFEAWLKQDVRAALAALENLPPDYGSPGDRLYSRIVDLCLQEPGGLEAVLPYVWCLPSPDDGASDAEPAPDWLTSIPPATLAAFFASHVQPGGFYAGLVSQFTEFWAGKDLRAARAWVDTLDPQLRPAAQRGVMMSWAAQDPKGVLSWLATEASSAEKSESWAPLNALVVSDPRAAVELAVQDWNRAQFLSTGQAFGPWVTKEPAAALAFALAQEDPAIREKCLATFAQNRSSGEAADALRTLTTPEDRETVLRNFDAENDAFIPGRGPLLPGPDPFATQPPTAEQAAAIKKAEDEGRALIQRTSPVFAAECADIARRDAPLAFGIAANLPPEYSPAALAAVLAQWPGPEAVAAVERLMDSDAKSAARAFLKTQGR